MYSCVFDFNVFSKQIVTAWKYAKSYSYKCCCPICNNKAIKSHLLQQHQILESICDEKNSLLQMVDNRKDPRSRDWNFYQRHNVGISEALQYKFLETVKGILLKWSNCCCSPKLYEDNDWSPFFDEYEELKLKSFI